MMSRSQHQHHASTAQIIRTIFLSSMVVIGYSFPITVPIDNHFTMKKGISASKLFSTSIPTDKNSNTINPKEDSYGERSRIYRRDVFNYDNWVEHRSTNRFVGNLFDVLKSGVFRQLLPNCFYMSSIALFIVLYNTIFVEGYDDFAGIHHDPVLAAFMVSLPLMKIPGDFFSLCTPSLALLLGTLCVYVCSIVDVEIGFSFCFLYIQQAPLTIFFDNPKINNSIQNQHIVSSMG